MTHPPIASVIVPLFQDAHTIQACLDSLIRQSVADRLQIIVVDDGSTDGGDVVVEAYPVELIRQSNAGAAAARNRGAQAALGEILIFLDSDCFVGPQWVERLLSHFANSTTSAALCPLHASTLGLVSTLVQSEIDERYSRLTANGCRIDFLAAAACAVRTEVFREVGGFNEAFRANEDVELAFKLDAAKHLIVFAGDAPAAHAHQTTWRALLRTKFLRGVWRIWLYKRFPTKGVRDAWTPWSLKLQIVCALVLPIFLVGAIFVPRWGWLAAAVFALAIASGWSTIMRTARALRPVVGRRAEAWAVIWLLARSATLAASVLYAKIAPLPPGLAKTQARTTTGRHLLPIAAVAILTCPHLLTAEPVTVRIGEIAGKAPPALLGVGGGVWRIPRVQEEITSTLLTESRPGVIRAALAWEVLAPSSSLDDIDVRLVNYRLNDFLVQAHRRGATIIVALDAMPRWLAANKSDAQRADGPAWAKSPPSDLTLWSEVAKRVVLHFTKLGLDPFYEVWNEPDWSYPGLTAYMDLYRATVRGAHQAYPAAKIAGPAISDWTSPTSPGANDVWLLEFLKAAHRENLPVAAVTWHAFYRAPEMYYSLAVPMIRSFIADAGLNASTPLILDEWNVAAEPPYPEGDLNGTYAGAAYVGASLIEMARHGISLQAYQMLVDPGTPGYSGGLFSFAGIPRPAFHTFRLAGGLVGQAARVESSLPFVHALAYVSLNQIHILIAVLVPSDGMLIRSAFDVLMDGDVQAGRMLQRLDRRALVNYLLNGGDEPAIPAAAKAAFHRGANLFWKARKARDRWNKPFDLAINLDAKLLAGRIEHYEIIDRDHAVGADQLAEITRQLQKSFISGIETQRANLTKSGLQAALIRRWTEAISAGRDYDLSWAPENARAQLAAASKSARAEFQRAHARMLSVERARSQGVPPNMADGGIVLATNPQAIHYFVLGRQSNN